MIEAKDGEEALALVKEHHPRIVILDWMMPKLNLVDAWREIRSDPDHKGTKIIVIEPPGPGLTPRVSRLSPASITLWPSQSRYVRCRCWSTAS